MSRESLRKNALALVFVAILALICGAGGYLSADQASSASTPGQIAPDQQAMLRGTLQSITGDSLQLSTPGGPVALKLTSSTHFEALRPTSAVEIRPGDWVNVGAVQHSQTIFAIVAVLVIPQELLEGQSR